MKQKNEYINSDAVRDKKQKYFLIAMMATVMMAAAITVYASDLPDDSANNEANNNLISKTHTMRSILIINAEKGENEREVEKESVIEVGYDYTKPVPKADIVDNDYFDDAVFIGDSRTEGMLLYTGLSNAIIYTKKGLMVDTVFTMPAIKKNGERISVMDALRQTEFGKVYIMLGINETGWPYHEVFIKKYGNIIDEIKKINPEAIIYVQQILPVTDKVSQTHSYVKNEKINEYNELIRDMAAEKEIYYIDVGKAVSDENGCLPEDASVDGIHLTKAYCEKWLEYIKTHTVTEIEG